MYATINAIHYKKEMSPYTEKLALQLLYQNDMEGGTKY